MTFVTAMKKLWRINATVKRQQNAQHEIERDSVSQDFYLLAFKDKVFLLPREYSRVNMFHGVRKENKS